MTKVIIPVFDDCMSGAVSATADLFMTAHLLNSQNKSAKKMPSFTLQIASADGNPVTSGSGQVIHSEISFDDIADADIVFVPAIFVGSEQKIIAVLDRLDILKSFVQRMHEQGCCVVSSCTGSFVLAEMGLLDDIRATTTWWLADTFRHRYPKVSLTINEMIVPSGDIITAGAGTAYLDLSIFLIQKFAGASLARQCAAYLCLDGPRESQNSFIIPYHRQSRDPFIERADRWLRGNLENRVDVEGLANFMNVSTRTLVRKFKQRVAQTPSCYIQQVRTDHAKYLLESTQLAISTIASRSGYSDEDAFRRAFRKQSSLTPTDYRRRVKRMLTS